jgi:hypothetical protein
MSLGRRERAAVPRAGAAGAITIVGAAPRTRWRRDVDLELTHEPQEIGPLEPERAGGPRPVAA